MSTTWLLSEISESKGRQELYTTQSPQRLRALRDMAIVESVESSNRIEGITVSADRLRPLVLGNARPRDRSEEEIQGYRNALRTIHADPHRLGVDTESLRSLHRMVQEGAGDAGEWKAINNDIIEFREGKPPRVRFRPVGVNQTPDAVAELCLLYHHALNQQRIPPLISTASLVLDFLCIHPFRDGNGRVSRLLTLLTLQHHGFDVGRFVSLERLIEDSKEDYYAVLEQSSQGWHEGQHDLLPWLNHFLAIVRRAFVQFEERVGKVSSPRGSKKALIESAIGAIHGPFALSDLERACPGVSRDMVRFVLRQLQQEGKVVCISRGRSAQWRKCGNDSETG